MINRMQQDAGRERAPDDREPTPRPIPKIPATLVPRDAATVAVPQQTGTPRRLWLPIAALLALLLPLGAIGLALRAAMPEASPKPSPAPIVRRVPSLNSHWLATKFTSEVDSLLEIPWQPGHLLAGTPTALWDSADDGATWQPDRGGLPTTEVLAMAAARSSSMLYAGTGDGVVYQRKASAGARWQRISPALGVSQVFSLAVSQDGHIILAGTNTAMYRGTEGGTLWHWTQVLHTDLSSIAAIAWLPWAPHEAFAAVFGSTPPVYQTTDDGHTWHPASDGLPSMLPSIQLLASTSAGQNVVLTTMGNGVWRTGGDGRWREISTGLPERHAMPVTVDSTGTLYAGTMGQGVYMKQGDGAWQLLGREMLGGQYIVLSLLTTHGAVPSLVAGTSSGLFRLPLPH